MTKRLGCLTGVIVLLASVAAQAIPPPWLLERDKAAADLILLARTSKSIVVKDDGRGRFRDMKIGLEPIEVLKGKLPAKDGKQARAVLLYRSPRPRQGQGVAAVAMGGAGRPKPADGETAMLFLRPDRKGGKHHYRVVCGSFGYIKLEAKTKKDLAAVTRRIKGYRKSCEKVKDQKARKAMEGYYDKALLAAAKRLAERTGKAAPWRVVAGESPTYRKAKERETVLRGKFIVKNYGKPGTSYLRPPQDYYLKTRGREVQLGPTPGFDGLADSLANKTVEVKGKQRPSPPGSRKGLLLVGWIRQVDAPDKPAPKRPGPPPAPGAAAD